MNDGAIPSDELAVFGGCAANIMEYGSRHGCQPEKLAADDEAALAPAPK
jgi:hypothetical protein